MISITRSYDSLTWYEYSTHIFLGPHTHHTVPPFLKVKAPNLWHHTAVADIQTQIATETETFNVLLSRRVDFFARMPKDQGAGSNV